MCSRAFFYMPIVFHHLEEGIASAGWSQDHTGAFAILALFAVGLTVSEFPSGVFADWAGRVRSLQVCAAFFAGGVLLYLWRDQIVALAAAQLLLGIGAGFLTGSDTALLHQHLEQTGQQDRYGERLARLRFWNAIGLVIAPIIGGWLYANAWFGWVFILTTVAQIAGAVALQGIGEPPRARRDRSYWRVLRESLAFAGKDRALCTMLLVASAGSTMFGFSIWTIQTHLNDVGSGPEWWGLAVGGCWVLSALSQPLSAWIGRTPARSARAWPFMLAALPLAFLALWLLQSRGWVAAASAVVIVSAAGTAIYRNACNVQIQTLVPDEVRASLVSLNSWLGSIWYVGLFPFFGWLLDTQGEVDGYGWIALSVAAVGIPLLAVAVLAGVWRGKARTPLN